MWEQITVNVVATQAVYDARDVKKVARKKNLSLQCGLHTYVIFFELLALELHRNAKVI